MRFNCHYVCVQVASMQFINIVVHSVENMNFRVHLQYEFTHLGLDKYLEVSWIVLIYSFLVLVMSKTSEIKGES